MNKGTIVDIWELRPGDKVRTVDGAVVEITRETEDGRWIPVRYIEDPENPSAVGSEDLCQVDELAEVVQNQASAEGAG